MKRALIASGWVALGVLLTLLFLWCRREYGREVAFRMYVRALNEKPQDQDSLNRIFGQANHTLVSVSDHVAQFRYRFSGGGEIDVQVDRKDHHVNDINPTFAAHGIGWLTWVLHRRRFFTVSTTIPAKATSGTQTSGE